MTGVHYENITDSEEGTVAAEYILHFITCQKSKQLFIVTRTVLLVIK